ncbi:hypothetical protein [Clostridium sp. C2-6-12]|uniref:hypothetical protein n=1 Tax=Clostridium sp. C2-6-12 TaxID=2698832 RepID=UPI0019242283|nr:hypothetical protein [Clostridium sp. C2-6-12]
MEELNNEFTEIKSDFRGRFEGGNTNLINLLEKYLEKNYYEFYNENNLNIVFQKAREDKNIEIKIVDTISKFILN